MSETVKLKIIETGMNNNSAMGYTISAMKNQGFKEKDIEKVIRQMYYEFDTITEKQTEKIYQNF